MVVELKYHSRVPGLESSPVPVESETAGQAGVSREHVLSQAGLALGFGFSP